MLLRPLLLLSALTVVRAPSRAPDFLASSVNGETDDCSADGERDDDSDAEASARGDEGSAFAVSAVVSATVSASAKGDAPGRMAGERADGPRKSRHGASSDFDDADAQDGQDGQGVEDDETEADSEEWTGAEASSPSFASAGEIPGESCAPLVGGQAVMEGILMRNGPAYALAIRTPDGGISVERRRWHTLTGKGRDGFLKKPFVRGFPILVETLINGIKALNRSAELSTTEEGESVSDFQLALTLFVALGLAVALFIVAPHLLSLGMSALGYGGGMEGLSFHLWDGFFKFAIFIGYIAGISFVPDIRRVFQYHGAEHKVIRAFENGGPVSARAAAKCSRLHPRCGTTFLLFVLSIAILLHALLVPLFLWLWRPENAVAKHLGTLCFKVLLMIPISALAYEIIRYAARLGSSLVGHLLRAPGLLLQLLTTREPDASQLEVAVAALYEALGEADRAGVRFEPPAYTVLE